MNELIIAGIILACFIALFTVTWIVENPDRICEWLFDIGTAYYKFKFERARKKARR